MAYNTPLEIGEKAAQDNLVTLANELSIFVETGASAIIGFDGDTHLNPRLWLLQYQANWIEYFSKTFQKEISQELLEETLTQLETVKFQKRGAGFLLFGSTGGLTEFYERIVG